MHFMPSEGQSWNVNGRDRKLVPLSPDDQSARHQSTKRSLGGKIRICVVSESKFVPAGHGVHTAFLEHLSYLESREEVQLVNSQGRSAPDLIHAHTVGPYALWLLSTAKTVSIATAHLLPESFIGSVVGAPWLESAARRYFPWFYNQADVVIAVSDHVKATLLDLGVRKPIFVLGNSVDVRSILNAREKRDAIRCQLGLDENDSLVVSVGQLQPRKGAFEFLRCAEQLPGVKFIWVGGPIFGAASSRRVNLYEAVDTAPVNFTYTGPVSHEKVFDYLNAADIYVSLSTQETFGTAVLEGAAAGLPLVLSNIPAFLHTYGDAAQFVQDRDAASIITSLARSSQSRSNWGRRAHAVALKYDRIHMGNALLSLYEEALSHAANFTD
jgi:1,2-diacylglycerol-3-alpha-glucose alpha-1,2-galactosyltransferase